MKRRARRLAACSKRNTSSAANCRGTCVQRRRRRRRSSTRCARPRPADLPAVREIYNYYVANSTVTFDEDAMSLKEWKSKFAYLDETRHAVRRGRVAVGAVARLRARDAVEAEARLSVHGRELDLPRPGGIGQGTRPRAARRAHRTVEGGGAQGDDRGHRRPGRRRRRSRCTRSSVSSRSGAWAASASSSTAGSAPCCCRRRSSRRWAAFAAPDATWRSDVATR